MELKQLPLAGKGFRGKLLQDYLQHDSFLSPFYRFKPSVNSFPDVITERKNFPVNRELLCNVLLKQHDSFLSVYPKLENNILALSKENSFTITTGHQLCVAGGPLFFIYKIITAINLAEELSANFPESVFVPVYWMATEDHDFEEIAKLDLQSDFFEWKHSSGKPTGRMDTNGLEDLLLLIKSKYLHSAGVSRLIAAMEQAYVNGNNLSNATRSFVLEFFAEHGLVVIDADDISFKQILSPVIEAELLHQSSFKAMMDSDIQLASRYSLQIHPREINLFYMTDEFRKRIVIRDEIYHVVDTNTTFTVEEILHELKNHPERFSPNVVLRPVYQELLLPNLAYIGGPAETAYWFQLKTVFDHYKVFFPMLVARNHGLLIEQKIWKNWLKLGLDTEVLFSNYTDTEKRLLSNMSSFESVLEDSSRKIEEAYRMMAEAITATDPTLKPMVLARHATVVKDLKKVQEKQLRAMRRKHATERDHLAAAFEMVKPGNTPQERVWSFASCYALYGDQWLTELKKGMRPFSDTLTVIHTD
jgi:bacillithiol synthase